MCNVRELENVQVAMELDRIMLIILVVRAKVLESAIDVKELERTNIRDYR